MNKYLFSIILAATLSNSIFGTEDPSKLALKKGDKWVLETRSNKFSRTNSEVLYHMPSDAINTYNARQFGDWDSFSIVDTRNLERLNTGDTLEIVKPRFNNKIYEVKLMDGFNKNRNFFIITDDLKNNFKQMELDS
jgi:hypothetical protein|tara:strand:- start:134 stop:541 length:408 start_codon:yes stop_codon:yes gene_type:complete